MKLSAEELLKALEESDFEAELIMSTPDLPLAQILVPIGMDRMNHALTLQIGLQEGPAAYDPDQLNPVSKLQLQFLQFLVLIPFQISPRHLADTHTLIDSLNTVIELPGFGIFEVEKCPFFRYTLLCNHKKIDKELFVMTVGLIMYVIDTYLDTIEQIASGKRTLADIEAQAKKTRQEESF